MTTRSPLFWLRWVTVALIVALCMSDLVSHADSYSRLHATLRSLVYIAYACLFLRNTAAFPRPDASGIWILVAQIATSTPLESNLSVVTAATIPLVLEKGRWRVWVSVTLSLVALQMVVRSSVYLYIRRAQLPSDVTPVAVAITLLSGLLEVLAWHVFAFLAAVLIVRFDEDRRRLTLLNAEMEGAQVLLMESGRLAERLRISRELHDSLGHHLTCLSLQLEVAEHLPDDQVRSKLAEARFLARLLLAEIREAVSQWRLETSPALPIALRSLSRGMPGLVVKFEMEQELPATVPSVAHALFRCTQEALTNSVRHGSAATVHVSLHHREEHLTLQIADDGVGCSCVVPGNGLRGMITRMGELGGVVSFESLAGRGFRIEIKVPIAEIALQ